ncbi:tripartite tricarboxylate transporter substrate binding protein [Roseibium marinum]|uniref:Tripartite-type tricarboxylate transporter receptor subunit TctC n=1 Tax=Roseibium marinum TaxID=281252 RepID=A0A2S3UJV0_9HYPH|nr:tripartite tricarboxylate transporter substrate binding protein [Roseibium marinum]POF27941.1 tripartite-type tricarboxylate transporter receptor subunit TctC [Roseibium marinum]
MNRRSVLGIFGGVMGLVMTANGVMAEGYPDHDIEILIPFSAGGGNDQVARTLAVELEDILGQSVVPVQKTGAGGYVAAKALVTGKPDGYTLGHQSLGTLMLGGLMKEQTVDALNDLRFVAQMALIQSAIAVKADSPYQTLDDLVEAMKADPGAIAWGHTGRGGFHFVNGSSLLAATGTEALDVPYKGSSKTTAALLGGHIDFALLSTSNVLGFEDEIRVLAFASDQGDDLLPDVKTVKELGIDMVTVATPSVITVHKDTPDDIVQTLEAAIREAVSRERYRDTLNGLGIAPVFADGAAIKSYLDANIGHWKALVDAAVETSQ